MEFHQRLTEAISRRGVTQAALAEHLEVSAASVSSWCAGTKRPTEISRLERMAEFLGVTPGFLQFGEGTTREPSDAELQPQRIQYQEELEWYWRPAPRDRGRELGNAAAYAFETDIPTLGRESAQNISDEKLDTAPTVDARYVVGELTGDALTSFLYAIKFDSVRPHLEAASKTNRKAGSVIGRGLAEVDSGRLIYIRIEDFDASGLTGSEFQPGRYMAVSRNVLDSQKDDTAGGSYGLGWATLPATSQFGLVLCNSQLSVAVDGRTRDRFVGVIDLPWHAVGGVEYAGRGWYGLPDPTDNEPGLRPTVSYWENEALARDALVYRPDSRPGTSFLIVGAYDASGAVDEIDEIAERISESLADNFWPAMVDRPDGHARLQAIVRSEKNGEALSEHYVNPARYQPAKVAAFSKHLSDNIVDSLDEAHDVVRKNVTLHVPARTVEPKHHSYDHEAILLVAQADDEEDVRQEAAPGTITYLRGSHMVVSSPRVTALPIGARSFHAIVLAGEAASNLPADRAADRFLRASEPPAHNKWTGTPEIKACYARGGMRAISIFDSEIKRVVREIIRQPSHNLSDGPDALKELIRISPPTTEGRRPRVKGVRGYDINEQGAWVITEAKVTLPTRPNGRGWTISPVLRFGTESGASISVKWDSLVPVSPCDIDDRGRLVTPPAARTAVFSAISAPESHPVGAHRAKALLDVQAHIDEVDS